MILPLRGSCIQNGLNTFQPLLIGLTRSGLEVPEKAISSEELEGNMLWYAGMSGHQASPETLEESLRQTR